MLRKLFLRSHRRLGSALLPLLMAGCMTSPQEASVVAQPKTRAVRNITSFSESLRCMDTLFANFGRRNIVITSAGIPDETDSISAGTKDMLISAISRMSVKSGAFKFVDFDQRQVDVHDLQSLVGFTDEFVVPNYYIRGAITQLDEGVLSESVAGAVGVSEFQVGAATDQVVSVVSLDLNIGNLVTRQILPGKSAYNSIAVVRTGYGGDLAANIESLGISFSVNLDRNEGMHQAVRTLVELSTIEVLGKLTQVPYWRCLAIEQTNPAVVTEARGWFEDMSSSEQVVFAQRALRAAGYYDGPVNGERDQTTKSAVARYQEDHGLIADGRIDFDLYASLISEDLALGHQPDPTRPSSVATPRPNPLTVTLATPEGSQPKYQVDDTLELTAVVSRDAYLYCYYSDARGSVVQIFPNQFQPDAYVIAGRSIGIPGKSAGFDIVFERPGSREEVMCLAAQVDAGPRLPNQLRSSDLRALPVGSLDDVATVFEQIQGLGLVAERMPITVVN